MLVRGLVIVGAVLLLAQAAGAASAKWTLTPTRVGGLDVRNDTTSDLDRIFGQSDVGGVTSRRCDIVWNSGITVRAILPASVGACTKILTVLLEERGCPALLGCEPLGRRWRAAEGVHIGSSLRELRAAYPGAKLRCRSCFRANFTPRSDRWVLAREQSVSSDRGRLVFEAMVRRGTVKAFYYYFART